MADYARRLHGLEDRAAVAAENRHYITREECEQRTAELLASKEMRAWMRDNPEPGTSRKEWAAVWTPIQDAIDAAQGEW